MARMATLLVVLVLVVGCVLASGASAFDLSRNLADDTLPNQQALARGAQRITSVEPRTGPPYIGRGLMEAILNQDLARGAQRITSVTNAPLVVRTLDDAIRAASSAKIIEIHDLSAPDDLDFEDLVPSAQ